MSLFKLYSNLLVTHPLKTKMATASVIFSAADIMCQKFVEEKKQIDYRRTCCNTFVGAFIQAPLLHGWMNVVLQRVLNIYLPRMGLLVNATNTQKTIWSVVLDQLLYSPFIQFFYYMSTNLLINGNLESGINAIKNKMPKSLVDSYKIWPASNYICYGYVPLQFRVLWTNLVGVGWQMYMSYQNNNHHHHHSHTQEKNQLLSETSQNLIQNIAYSSSLFSFATQFSMQIASTQTMMLQF
ncbi:hypothetical protein ABPG72_022771 [Tetrahymena utriculariae]